MARREPMVAALNAPEALGRMLAVMMSREDREEEEVVWSEPQRSKTMSNLLPTKNCVCWGVQPAFCALRRSLPLTAVRQKRKSVSAAVVAVVVEAGQAPSRSQTVASCKRHDVGGRWEALQVNRHGEFLALRASCLAKAGTGACLCVCVCPIAFPMASARQQRMDDVDAVICSKQRSAVNSI